MRRIHGDIIIAEHTQEPPAILLDAQKLKDVLLELNGKLVLSLSGVKKNLILRPVLAGFGLNEMAISRILKHSIHDTNRDQPLTIALHRKSPEHTLLNIEDFAMIPPTAKYFSANMANLIAHIEGITPAERAIAYEVCEKNIREAFKNVLDIDLPSIKQTGRSR